MACEAAFNDPCFLFAFLPAFLLLFWGGAWLLRRDALVTRWKLACIVGGGFVFYSFWDARFAGLLLVAATVDFFLGLKISGPTHRRRWLVASIVFNLGVLAIFKYAVFAAENARTLLSFFGSSATLPYFSIVLPIGISFFTFKTMSYTIDVYRGEVDATRDFLKYLAFISIFVDLVAGPIIRYRELSQQLDRMPPRLAGDDVAAGLAIVALGLFKKAVVADSIAELIDPLWAAPTGLDTPLAWLAAVGFALQLYFDFSGYSDMAIGLGMLMGLTIPRNFDAPYQARNPSDFWRRWHMSLSRWLRDYLYVPLGGNRGTRRRVAVNLMVVMLLGGLWHGAGWTFVLWGAVHGAALVAYHFNRERWDALPVALQRAGLLLVVVLAWVLFRAPDVATAGVLYHAMFVPAGLADGFATVRALGLRSLIPLALAALAALLVPPMASRLANPMRSRLAMAATMTALSLLAVQDGDSPFLYYQF